MLRFSLLSFVATAWLVACAHTPPGTYVEIVDKEGAITYVSGAVGIGVNKSLACEQAVGRAVSAAALKFADKNDDVAEEIGKAVGVEDGRVFLQRYAKATASDSAVQDVQFDPIDHQCVVAIRWKPPVFVKDAVMKYAEAVKRQELGGDPAPAPAPAAVAAPVRAPAVVPTVAPAPAPAASAAPPPDPCKKQRSAATKAQAVAKKANDDFAECTRRTSGDERMCSRYKLYVEEGKAKEDSAVKLLDDCKSINP
jgi:hypothetical protein